MKTLIVKFNAKLANISMNKQKCAMIASKIVKYVFLKKTAKNVKKTGIYYKAIQMKKLKNV